jgi:hypothetical protein
MTLNLSETYEGVVYNEQGIYLKDLPVPVYVCIISLSHLLKSNFIYKPKVQIQFFDTVHEKDGNFVSKLDYTFNACKFSSSFSANLLLKFVLEIFVKANDRKLKCPYRKV